MKFIPHPWQDQIIGHQLDVGRNAAHAGMGTGKTGATMTALQMVQDLLDPRPAIVFAPKRVASRTWPREIHKWDHLDGDCTPILGSAAERLSALRAGLRAGNSRLFSINYENIPWLIDTLGDLKIAWPFATAIADESTKLKSFRLQQGGQRAQALSKVAFLSDRFWELTGTPAPNGYKDLWGQVWFLDRGQRLGKSYSAYMRRWFVKDYTGFSWDILDHSPAQIEDRLRDICLSVSVPVDKPIINKIMVDLPPKARELYRKMEKESFVEIAGKGIEAAVAAGKVNKCLQIASGHMYDEDGRAHFVHDAKIEALQSVIGEAAGMPVLVAVNFKFEAPAIIAAFPGARLLDTDQDIDDFAAGKVPVGIAHPAMLGHGINDMERGTNIGVFFSGDWNLEYHDQIIERIGPMRQKQSGLNRPVYLHYLLAENTFDEDVFERRVNKTTVQDALRKALERRG